MTTDPLATVRQTIPQLLTVLKNTKPTFQLPDISPLDDEFFERHGIKGAIWDVDGTLMKYHAMDVDPQFREQVRRQFRDGPVRHAILSNSHEARFTQLGTIFPEIPVLRGYATPDGPVPRRLLGGHDTHTEEEVRALLKRGRQLRKPSGDLVRFAMDEMGTDDPETVLMIGDQYLTDVASANLANTKSVKVPTFGRESFPANIRFTQSLEGLLYRIFNGSPRQTAV